MLIATTKPFARWARHEAISDKLLVKAIRELEAGIVDAHLGSGLVKKRIARPGGGKRGGYRTIIAFRHAEVAIFLFGFAKNELETVGASDLAYLRELASVLLSKHAEEIRDMILDGRLFEVRSK